MIVVEKQNGPNVDYMFSSFIQSLNEKFLMQENPLLWKRKHEPERSGLLEPSGARGTTP